MEAAVALPISDGFPYPMRIISFTQTVPLAFNAFLPVTRDICYVSPRMNCETTGVDYQSAAFRCVHSWLRPLVDHFLCQPVGIRSDTASDKAAFYQFKKSIQTNFINWAILTDTIG